MSLLPDYIQEQVRQSLNEDVASGDLTAMLVPQNAHVKASIITRQKAVIVGKDWVEEVFNQLDSTIEIHWFCDDGDEIESDGLLCEISGNARSLLTGERTALNFLQTLSAVATKTRLYVDVVKGTNVNILDTRKTIPGLRLSQKYAVTCGGGVNHRIGLYDAMLIKENHIAAAGSIASAFEQALKLVEPEVSIEMEVESLDEMEQALNAGVERLLLDNFNLQQLRDAVSLNNEKYRGKARLEASGNVTLETVRAIAETGVNDISVGELTKNIAAVDLSMRILSSDIE